MKIFYAFDNGKYSYNCGKCGGICCIGNLYLTKKEVYNNEKIMKFYDFIDKRDDGFVIKQQKKCWLLENNSCGLKNSKPLVCSMYPVTFFKLTEDIVIVEFIPCPTSNISRKGFVKHEYRNSIIEYLSAFDLQISSYADMILDFHKYDIEREINKISKLFYDSDNVIISLFEQVLFYPPLLLLSLDKIEYLRRYWFWLYSQNSGKIDNTMNLYLFMKLKIIKFALRQYYTPIKNGKNILNFDKKNVGLFNKYFRDTSIKWKICMKNEKG